MKSSMNDDGLNYDPLVDDISSHCFKEIKTKFHLNYKGGDNKVKETSAEKEAARINIEKWNHSMQKFEPLKQEYLKDVGNLDSQGRSDYATGKTSQDTLSAFDKVSDSIADSQTRNGINPNSGSFKASLGDVSIDEGESSGTGMGRAEVSIKEAKGRGLMNAINIGRGESSQAQRGLNDIASSSQSKAIYDAQESERKRQNNLSNAGSAVGLAAYGYGKYQDNQKEGKAEQDLQPVW